MSHQFPPLRCPLVCAQSLHIDSDQLWRSRKYPTLNVHRALPFLLSQLFPTQTLVTQNLRKLLFQWRRLPSNDYLSNERLAYRLEWKQRRTGQKDICFMWKDQQKVWLHMDWWSSLGQRSQIIKSQNCRFQVFHESLQGSGQIKGLQRRA